MATTNKGVQYVCPMDSDIITDEPSRCSKCGMDLEPVYLEIDLERIEKIQKRELKTALDPARDRVRAGVRYLRVGVDRQLRGGR